MKEVWDATLDAHGSIAVGSQLSKSEVADAGDEDEDDDGGTNVNGGVTLMDDDVSHVQSFDWQGRSVDNRGPIPLQPTNNRGYAAPRPPIEGMGQLSLNYFPALTAQNKVRAGSSSRAGKSKDEFLDDNLISLEESSEEILRKQKPISAWTSTNSASGNLFKVTSNPKITKAGWDAAALDVSSDTSSSALPGFTTALQENRNPDSHIQVKKSGKYLSTISAYDFYEPTTGLFICPGSKCGERYKSPEAFISHFNTGAHVGGKTNCPSCCQRFGSTAALIAHCESGSKKCNIRHSANYNQIMRELTAGLIGTEGHHEDGTVKYIAVGAEERNSQADPKPNTYW